MKSKREARELRPARQNANRHTVRGLALLDDAMSRDGFVAPITVAADGEALDGSARMERAAERFPDVEPLVVEHDGTRPVVMVRTDIPSADTPQAKRIAIAANRIAEVDLEWDSAVLKELADDELDLEALGFDGDELAAFEHGEDWSEAMEGAGGAESRDFQQMTFTLANTQVEAVNAALRKAIDAGPFAEGNENSNGNALARIAEVYLGG